MAEPWSVEDRLRQARLAFRRRQPAHPALASLCAADGPAAPASGPTVRVDSFLSSRNTARVADGYPSLLETHVEVHPTSARGRVDLRLRSAEGIVEGFEVDGDVVLGGHDVVVARRLEPGTSTVQVVARGHGYRGVASRVSLAHDPALPWPDGLQIRHAVQGRHADGAHPFRAESSSHPEIVALRARLAEHGVGAAPTDVETARMLRQWVKGLWDHEIPRRSPPYNGRLIIDRALRCVDTFICMHYSVAFVHACAALGLPARVVNLHRNVAVGSDYVLGEEGSHDPPIDEHVTAEVWCRDLGRWVMMDTDFDCHYLRDGEPQSAWDIHEALMAGDLGALQVVRGPGSSAYDGLGENFFPAVLPTYYRHVSLLMRSDFITDPDGPVPVLHLTDPGTPPILWHDGEDLRLHPHLMGPVVVARQLDDRTALLTDGSLDSAWASTDEDTPHWVDVSLPAPRVLAGVGLSWPEVRGTFMTSRAYRIVGRRPDGSVVELAGAVDQGERPRSRHVFTPQRLAGLRVEQAPGGGSLAHPHRLWLTQLELLDADSDDG